MATPLSTDAEAYLSRVDPLLGEVITRYSPLEPRTRSEDYFTALSRSITGQQISVKAAAAIFAPDDRGLQIAIERLYELPATPSRSELMALAEKWSPYRSTASFYLWKSLDNEPA